ncbi:phosphatidylserine/phosphatidylglycerophosphate/cardiolipin synthase family protein [Flaviflexus salsibiostraticola]|uniref:Phosphatidylserine/phosphatidylglycerophosphate/ cardiolipin synthase family protein n=1 Tax=Flaviflexus salsibiostraticola TaxID=1282737 RepID=A0A3Q8WTM1_9ACTO|nr:phospholipase D-like domain-containing protein [Flaviflexus salsibiostraticola]AZN29836.1 phosphatidylserine/phosphatidylglycerophosphate/cardiolipin synthase family protein [Flaviflexus salsibiostraticola]
MSRYRAPSMSRLWRGVKAGLAVTFALQATAVGIVTAIDERRKRREPATGEFPHFAPKHSHVANTQVTTYTFGHDLYEDMIEAIESAEHTVYLETYIWKADAIGQRFRDAIIGAAERGVSTYVIVDVFGNLNQDPRFRHFPDLENLHVRRFPFLHPGRIFGFIRHSGLDHRKLLIVDSTISFVGGYNIGQLYADHWRDTHIRLVGPQTWELENAFIDMWNAHRKRGAKRLTDRGTSEWDSRVRAVQNLPSRLSYPIRSIYLGALDRAASHAWITMGYFIPDRDLQEALIAAADRGVDVRVLIPEYSNHIVADWAGRPSYKALLDAGVRIFLYQGAMVHSKTMTVDGKWSTVGTANIDALSMRGNYEVNAEIYSESLAGNLETIFDLDLTNSRELTSEMWENRPLFARVLERILRPLGVIL